MSLKSGKIVGSIGLISPASMSRFDASPDAETPSYRPWFWVMSVYMSSDVSAGLTFTVPQSGLAASNGWTQSYSLTLLPSSA